MTDHAIPSEAQLDGLPKTPIDAVEFQNLIRAAEPEGGSVLWIGSLLVVTEPESGAPSYYRISYYGSFFRKLGTSGYYVVPGNLRRRWGELLMQPGALGRIIDQRIDRNQKATAASAAATRVP